MGSSFYKIKGKGLEKKFLTLLTDKLTQKQLKVKFAIKEELESSEYRIF